MSNREIKFRAFNKKQQQFIYSDWKYGVPSFWETVGNDFTGEFHLPVQQFTGLKDENGVDIYEGDILKVTGPWDDEGNSKNIVVEFCDEGGYAIEWSNAFCGGDADLTLLGWARNEGYTFGVIGNIWEDPNLLMK